MSLAGVADLHDDARSRVRTRMPNGSPWRGVT
jgi:hypothetical protein